MGINYPALQAELGKMLNIVDRENMERSAMNAYALKLGQKMDEETDDGEDSPYFVDLYEYVVEHYNGINERMFENLLVAFNDSIQDSPDFPEDEDEFKEWLEFAEEVDFKESFIEWLEENSNEE